MKIIGICIVSAIVVFYGFSASRRYSKRIKFLESMILFIDFVENQIRFLGSTVESIFEEAINSHNFVDLFFLKDVKNNGNSRFCMEYQESILISISEFEHVSLFLSELGCRDIDGEIAHCKVYKEIIKNDLEGAKTDFNNKGKLYKSMSVLTAAALMIILI